MKYFVEENSIVRSIWGKSDTILFVFAGGAAEFALNKAVDWLYFTGKLPADPIGRLLSTVAYARAIVFSENQTALKAIDTIAAIHADVETKRNSKIPDWAYRDVLFMLIDYSIRSYELLERKLTNAEKQEVFDVFNRVGSRMGLLGLPKSYKEWLTMRAQHLKDDLKKSPYTDDLYKQYKIHLGAARYKLLLEAQILVIPNTVRDLLGLRQISTLKPAVPIYKLSKFLKLDTMLKEILLPPKYKSDLKKLDRFK